VLQEGDATLLAMAMELLTDQDSIMKGK